MKLYVVGSGWGGSGYYVVIAESPERAVELVAVAITVPMHDFMGRPTGEVHIRDVSRGEEQKYIAALKATELTDDLTAEFVSEEWGEE